MIPILFEDDTTSFFSSTSPYPVKHGLGDLTETLSCKVTMATDGLYELELEYPSDGRLFTELQMRRIILAGANQVDGPQAFRICRIRRQIDGRVHVEAKHVSYDLNDIPVGAFQAKKASVFAGQIMAAALTDSCFTFATDVDWELPGEAVYKNPKPCSARSLLVQSNSGEDLTWTTWFGGHIVFDNFNVYRIAFDVDRHLILRYGKDLIDTQMEQSDEQRYTGIVPYYSKDGVLVVGDIIPDQEELSFDYERIRAVDVTEQFGMVPAGTEEQKKELVKQQGYLWLAANNFNGQTDELNLRLSYAQIDQKLRLCDKVTVKAERFGIDNIVTTVCKTVWDTLKERYDSVEVGNTRYSFAADMANAGRLTKGELSVDRIKNGSIGSGKLSGNVQNKLNTMVTTPFDGTFETIGLKFNHTQCAWVHLVGDNINAWVIGSYNSPDD